MEDLFQIIIIVFFILSSIASSINKKKKQQQKLEKKKPVSTPAKDVDKKTVKPAQQKSTSEMFEELLGFKVDLPESQNKGTPIDFSEDSIKQKESWDPAKDFANQDDSEFISPVPLKKKYSVPKVKSIRSEKVKRQVSAKKDSAIRKQNKYSTKLFANNPNLKDYIIIQEILNKPKALRK
ncbi:MAG: hypothetical protein CR986_04275 [Ignavibacteriae bacterium]|nr:MAG: hypothetical protein CR986_04275 [Ignavibacteriota bacterium]